MLAHWPGQGILDRNHCTISVSRIQSFEDLYGTAARNNFAFGHELNCRLMAECSSLSLDRNFHVFHYTLEELSIFEAGTALDF